jgi:hypothetical protein
VEILWTFGANPVENPTTKIFIEPDHACKTRTGTCGCALREALRLIICDVRVKSTAFARSSNTSSLEQHPVIVHRFEETICGRAYQIEVTAVSNRWRAQLRRLPGMPTAMMPFYGQTPDEAARQLTKWLVLAHQRLLAAKSAT